MHSRKAKYTDPAFLSRVRSLACVGMSNNQIANKTGSNWHTVDRARKIIEGRMDEVKAHYGRCDFCGKETLMEGKAKNCIECQEENK